MNRLANSMRLLGDTWEDNGEDEWIDLDDDDRDDDGGTGLDRLAYLDLDDDGRGRGGRMSGFENFLRCEFLSATTT